MSLCGSVARGVDREADVEADVRQSDIDFYAWEFRGGDDARQRAEDLVAAYNVALSPFKVDIRAWPELPGFFLDDHECYRRDAVRLSTLIG